MGNSLVCFENFFGVKDFRQNGALKEGGSKEDGFCRPLENCQQRKRPPKGKRKPSTKDSDLNGVDSSNTGLAASL